MSTLREAVKRAMEAGERIRKMGEELIPFDAAVSVAVALVERERVNMPVPPGPFKLGTTDDALRASIDAVKWLTEKYLPWYTARRCAPLPGDSTKEAHE